MSTNKLKFNLLKKVICAFLTVTFSASLVQTPRYASASAANISVLPGVGAMVGTTEEYRPIMIKGVNIHPQNALKLDFIVSNSSDKNSDSKIIREKAERLVKYFFASLAMPEKDMWVNLSPYEKDRIIAKDLGNTDMGQDMLAQDYILKQLTSSLMSPESELGKKFWEKIYAKAKDKIGVSEIPVNTFNKVWIMPKEAKIYEHEKGAVILESSLKVMLADDYVAMQKSLGNERHGELGYDKSQDKVSDTAKQALKDIIIPAIEEEVNKGKTFAQLRQIYNAFILASWYKKNLKESLLGKVYADKQQISSIESKDKTAVEKIYTQYVESFKKGAFNFIKEEYDENTQNIIPRKYFSGGFLLTSDRIKEEQATKAQVLSSFPDGASVVNVDAAQNSLINTGKVVADKEKVMRFFTHPLIFSHVLLLVMIPTYVYFPKLSVITLMGLLIGANTVRFFSKDNAMNALNHAQLELLKKSLVERFVLLTENKAALIFNKLEMRQRMFFVLYAISLNRDVPELYKEYQSGVIRLTDLKFVEETVEAAIQQMKTRSEKEAIEEIVNKTIGDSEVSEIFKTDGKLLVIALEEYILSAMIDSKNSLPYLIGIEPIDDLVDEASRSVVNVDAAQNGLINTGKVFNRAKFAVKSFVIAKDNAMNSTKFIYFGLGMLVGAAGVNLSLSLLLGLPLVMPISFSILTVCAAFLTDHFFGKDSASLSEKVNLLKQEILDKQNTKDLLKYRNIYLLWLVEAEKRLDTTTEEYFKKFPKGHISKKELLSNMAKFAGLNIFNKYLIQESSEIEAKFLTRILLDLARNKILYNNSELGNNPALKQKVSEGREQYANLFKSTDWPEIMPDFLKNEFVEMEVFSSKISLLYEQFNKDILEMLSREVVKKTIDILRGYYRIPEVSEKNTLKQVVANIEERISREIFLDKLFNRSRIYYDNFIEDNLPAELELLLKQAKLKDPVKEFLRQALLFTDFYYKEETRTFIRENKEKIKGFFKIPMAIDKLFLNIRRELPADDRMPARGAECVAGAVMESEIILAVLLSEGVLDDNEVRERLHDGQDISRISERQNIIIGIEVNLGISKKMLFEALEKVGISLKTAVKSNDAALKSDINGGIDFNSNALDMEIKMNGNGVIIPVHTKIMEDMAMSGNINPVIINIVPAKNLEQFLGF